LRPARPSPKWWAEHEANVGLLASITEITKLRNHVVMVERGMDDLCRFVKKVADHSNDGWLVSEAEELIVLYGNPDAKKPEGVIKNA
jgi:hypothetical protein